MFQCTCLPLDLSTGQCQGKKNENQINLSNHDGTPLNLSKQGQSSDQEKPKRDKSQNDSNANQFPNIFIRYKVEADAIITAMFKNVTDKMETITKVKERLIGKLVKDSRKSKGSQNMFAKYHSDVDKVVPSMTENVANRANLKEMVNKKHTEDHGKTKGSQDVMLNDKSEADEVIIPMLKHVTDNTKTITEAKERLNSRLIEDKQKAQESHSMFVKYNSEADRVITAMFTNMTNGTGTFPELEERLNSKSKENSEKATKSHNLFVKYNNEENRVVTKMLTKVTGDSETIPELEERLNNKPVEDKLKANGFQDVFVKYQEEVDALVSASFKNAVDNTESISEVKDILNRRPANDHGKAIKFAHLKRSLVTKAVTIKHIDKVKQKPYEKSNAENVHGQQTIKCDIMSFYGGGDLKGFIKMTFSAISYKFIMEFSFSMFLLEKIFGGFWCPTHSYNDTQFTCIIQETFFQGGMLSRPMELKETLSRIAP